MKNKSLYIAILLVLLVYGLCSIFMALDILIGDNYRSEDKAIEVILDNGNKIEYYNM